MLFDTDILIWFQKRNAKAAQCIDAAQRRCISVLTYMELLQCPQSKEQQRLAKDFLAEFNFTILPMTENIGHRASIYIEDYSLATGMRTGDAIVAATAMERNLELMTGNRKHFKSIPGLKLKLFRP
ncbi:MAG: type II toxin-antitoxin system VapC family toxin [Deltaproteobacteria bacterium]|nr:type II toxin-antitoxin system VapC family toxin [Deltaproteobacteria bacterium]